jgi:hypothetical protein
LTTEDIFCSQCGRRNTAGFRYCQSCGAQLATTGGSQPLAPAVQAGLPPTAPVVQRPYSDQTISQMGTGGISVLDIWGPFAGYGERGRHVSWLLDNLGEQAEALRNVVTERFEERRIPAARIEQRSLTAKGLVVERRPYYLIRRDNATAGLYIARFGRDLFISQVTYFKGAIQVLRAVIFVLMIAFQAYLIFGYGRSLESSATSWLNSFDLLRGFSGSTGEMLGFLLCCIGPLGILNTLALAFAGVHMIYKFITEKDPWALLRTPPNEFELDDIMAIEKAVEETVRQSLDRVDIDVALMPPAEEYGFKRRLI